MASLTTDGKAKVSKQPKRIRLPPDPSSTLLQGIYLTVPGHGSGHKLLPAKFTTGSIPHDVSYRLDASIKAKSRSQSPVRGDLSQLEQWGGVENEAPENLYGAKSQTTLATGNGQWARSKLAESTPRNDAFLLRQWLQAEVESFNQRWGKHRGDASLVEFLALAQQAADALFGQAFVKLASQVDLHCQAQGALLRDAWAAGSAMTNGLTQRLVSQHATATQQAEEAEAREATSQTLHAEADSAAQAEIARLKEHIAELQEAAQNSLAAAAKRPDANERTTGGARASMAANPRQSMAGTATAAAAAPGTAPRKSGIKFTPETAPGPPGEHGVRIPEKSSGKHQSVAQAVRAGSKRASMMAESLLAQLQDAAGTDDEATSLGAQNEALKIALEDSRRDLQAMAAQIQVLEQAADEMVNMESRAQVAEGERDAAMSRLACYTPRPAAPLGSLPAALGPALASRLAEAVAAHRAWPPEDVARMLFGEASGQDVSALEACPACFACLLKPIKANEISRANVLEAVEDNSIKPIAGHLDGQQAAWLGSHMLTRGLEADPSLLVDFLAGATEGGLLLSASFYGCLQSHRQAVSMEKLMQVITSSQEPTAQRLTAAEEEARRLVAEIQAIKDAEVAAAEAELKRQEGRKRREEEARLEKKNPVDAFLDQLIAGESENGEAFWKDGFSGVGAGPEVHKLLRTNGQVRNRHMSKRETEKLIKEVWKERMADNLANKGAVQPELGDFLFQFLQKKVGIQSAVIETGYNMIYWLWKYSFDADCDLFLKILKGDVREDVYTAQRDLQEEILQVFVAADKAANKAETGVVNKADARLALEAHLKVGQPRCKTLARFDELMQCLDTDQPGPTVETKKIFEEDREFNQGAFAEQIREQWLQERMEYFSELEQAIFDEALGEDECTRAHVQAAINKLNPDLSEEKVLGIVDDAFMAGAQRHTVKLVMKRLKATQGRLREDLKPKAKAAATGKKKSGAAAGSQPASASKPATKPAAKGKAKK